MATTICDLVALGGLGLRLVADSVDQNREIRSVHTTDLEQPGRYLLPGELVLTNGLWHGAVPTDAWIFELSSAGASALGFGLGAPHRQIPADVPDACERNSMPLIEIPEHLSFVAISDAVAAAHAEDLRSVLRRHLERSRAMLHGVSDGGGIAFLLDVLHSETGLDAALVNPGGRVIAAAGESISVEQAARAATDARRRRLPWEVEPGLTVFGPVADQLAADVLVVRAGPSEIDDEARIVINQVTDYVELESGRRRSERQARWGIAQELVDLLRAGALSAEGLAARAVALGLDPELPIMTIAFGHDLAEVSRALEAVGGPFALAAHADSTIALAQPPEGSDAFQAAASAIADMGGHPTIGGGGSGLGPTELARSLSEALVALNLARGRGPGQRVVGHRDLGSHALLLALLDPDVLRAFREQVLGPIERWDLDHGTDLVHTLRVFLANGGHWRQTAGHLHIHHNTLRYRLGRVELLTGRHLGEADERLDVQIALLVPHP